MSYAVKNSTLRSLAMPLRQWFLLAGIALFALAWSHGVSSAAQFCVNDDQALNAALLQARSNGENDIIKVTVNARVGSVEVQPEPGFSTMVSGGWNADCTQRLVSRAATQTEAALPPGAAANIPSGPQQSTTGPVPPPGTPVSDAAPVIVSSLADGSQVVVLGVPAYSWRHGCAPTALGMIVGYWNEKGYSSLVPGSASTQTEAVNQAIASQRDEATPGNYEDYCLPLDSNTESILPDRSEGGAVHTNDSIADFMLTSRSARQNRYGWSWSSDLTPAFTQYVSNKSATYVAVTNGYQISDSTMTWSVLTTELDNNRPMIFLVDTEGTGSTNHFVTIVGYRDTPSRQYACFTTWDQEVHWYDFAAIAQGQAWGVWGGWSFGLSGGTATPSIFWRNTADGRNKLWRMSGSTVTGSSDYRTLNPVWRMCGVGDFNADGQLDVAWRNTSTGQNAIWLMQNGTPSTVLAATVEDQAWQIQAVGDFNRDGKADLLWRNMSTGANKVWYMDSASHTSADFTALPDTNWFFGGAGDFNADGYVDVVLRNGSTGENSIWLLNGISVVSASGITQVTSADWRITAVADYNGDGVADIYWRNSVNGKDSVWVMNSNLTYSVAWQNQVGNVNWTIGGAGAL